MFDFIESVLMTFQGDLSKHGLSPGVLLRDEVTRHGPQVNESFIPLFSIFHPRDHADQTLKADHLLSHVCSIQAVDTVRADHAVLESLYV